MVGGSAVVSASGGRVRSPVSRETRGYEISRSRTRTGAGEDFVAGLTAHGGRR